MNRPTHGGRRRPRAQRGMTLVEVLVATGILSLAMGAAYTSLIAQIRRHAGQMMVSETLHAGRVAFDAMTAEIANAGFGVPVPTSPSAAPSLVIAEPGRLRFWSNPTTAHSYLTAPAAVDAKTLTVLSGAGIKPNASLYVADTNRWYLGTVQGVSNTSVQLAVPLTYNFAPGTLIVPVELVTYEIKNGALLRNGRVFIPNVGALQFTYDAEKLDAIRLVTIGMTVRARAAETAGGARRSVTLGARVTPRNLAL